MVYYACEIQLCLWHIIMLVSFIVMVYYELRGVRYTGQISKKGGGFGCFAECHSAKRRFTECRAKTLGEETNFCYSGNLFCRVFCLCRVYSNGHSAKWSSNLPVARLFAECIGRDTRQSVQTLTSAFVLTLGKLYNLYRVFWSCTQANFSNFTECFGDDTRQSLQTLPSVLGLTLGKLEKLYRVFSVGHSAKSPSPCHPVIILC